MDIFSLDIETTGLNPLTCQVLHIALVHDNTELVLPFEKLWKREALIRHPDVCGEHTAILMNAELLKVLEKPFRSNSRYTNFEDDIREYHGRQIRVFSNKEDAIDYVLEGVPVDRRLVIAGKNAAGFDISFLGPRFKRRTKHRVIDVGSVALGRFTKEDWAKHDAPPSLSDLVDLVGRPVLHDALHDAIDVLNVLRGAQGQPLLLNS